MMNGIDRLDSQLLARIAKLTFRSRRLIEGSLSGSHKSPHRGASVEFAEHKEYAPGDNLRHLDWRHYAKSDKYYVKQFEEETNLRAMLLLDASGSMAYRGTNSAPTAEAPRSKFEFASTLLAAFGFVLLRQQDAVGLTIAADGLRQSVPARTRATHLRAILALLSRATPAGTGDLTGPVREHLETASRRGLVVIASDLLDQPPSLPLLLRQVRGRGHDVIVVHTLHDDELTFTFEEPLLMEALEDDRKILIEPREIRTAYRREVDAFVSGWRQWAVESDVGYLVANTSRDIADTLVDFLLARERTR